MVAANAAARDARFIRRLHASIGKPIPPPGAYTGAGAYTADGRVGEYTRVGSHVLLVRGEDFEYFPDVGLDAKAEKHGQGSK